MAVIPGLRVAQNPESSFPAKNVRKTGFRIAALRRPE